MPSETSFHSELKSTLKNLAVAVLVEKLKKKDIDINVFGEIILFEVFAQLIRLLIFILQHFSISKEK